MAFASPAYVTSIPCCGHLYSAARVLQPPPPFLAGPSGAVFIRYLAGCLTDWLHQFVETQPTLHHQP